jgi:thiol-disulfide isomerase/thioredoxin
MNEQERGGWRHPVRRWAHGGGWLVLSLGVVMGVLGCASKPVPMRPVDYAELAAAERPDPPVAPARISALLLNGGGRREINYASHLAHLRTLVSLLATAGVSSERIAIFSSDGDAPALDLALEEPAPKGSFLLAGSKFGERLLAPTRFGSSSVPSVPLRPATRAELRRWFETTGAALGPGDTLLLYVTDHGERGPNDVMETRIVLWGAEESLSVRELRGLLRGLRRGVRVVSLMSQCFSGGFAWLAHNDGERVPEPKVCGYFSARYDRLAYGCYSGLSETDAYGHSFAFMQALARSGAFDEAHRQTLVDDRTPDVPLRSSDLWLQDLLGDLANAANVPVDGLIDALLAQAWEKRAAWEPEIRLIDRIGETNGFASPRSVRELQELSRQLSNVHTQIRAHTEVWQKALTGLTQGNLRDFLAANRSWTPRLEPKQLGALEPPERRELAEALLRELGVFTADREAGRTLELLSARADAGETLAMRTDTRVAGLLRMGAVLSSIAGRVYLGSQADPALLAAYRGMRACESFSLPGLPAPTSAGVAPRPPPPLPPLEELLRAAEALAPAWTGFETEVLSPARIDMERLPGGAARVKKVDARSPAEAALIGPGDLLLGPPGKPFARPQDLVPWSLLLEVGRPEELLLRRKSDTFRATITPRAFPVQWPSLGRQPLVGGPAPKVSGTLYRGEQRPAGRHILFFWETWCGPCKASIPSLLERARQEGAPVVAITDEDPATLEAFFADWKGAFPAIVISDEQRRSMVDYGVSATPTFVLVDDGGRILRYESGYSREQGVLTR